MTTSAVVNRVLSLYNHRSSGLGRDHWLFTDTLMNWACVWFHVVYAHVCFWCFTVLRGMNGISLPNISAGAHQERHVQRQTERGKDEL